MSCHSEVAHGGILFNCLIIAITGMNERSGFQVRVRGLVLWSLTLLPFLFKMDDSRQQFSQTNWFISSLLFPHLPPPALITVWGLARDFVGRGSAGVWFGVYYLSPCPIKFHQRVPWQMRRTLVWRQSQLHGRRFPRVREMVSSTTVPYFTKLKMERNSVSELIDKLKEPQAPDRCYG